MNKISSLNYETKEESGTAQVLEQMAIQQYAKALGLLQKSNLRDTTQLLKNPPGTELLCEVQKSGTGENALGTQYNLNYLCRKYLASMLASENEIDGTIESCCAALELNETNVILWHRLGELCMQAKRYEMALHAFQKGAVCNPQHWPCLDKIITLLLGLDFKEKCISTIYDTLQLNPCYLRGLAYRKHIYTMFPYIRDFMKYLNPIYDWNENEDEPIDKDNADKLVNEASEIHKTFVEQQRADHFKCKLPDLNLKKSIYKLTWQSIGNYLVNMHAYTMKNFSSHAYFIELVCDERLVPEVDFFENEVTGNEIQTEKDLNNVDMIGDDKPVNENYTFNQNNGDMEVSIEIAPKQKDKYVRKSKIKKPKSRKKAAKKQSSELSYPELLEWSKRSNSNHNKPKQRQHLDNISDTLHRMVPPRLSRDLFQQKEKQAGDLSPNTKEIAKKGSEEYFGSESEQKEVEQFINWNTDTRGDITEMLKEYLSILAKKWRVKWPEELQQLFIEVNKCYNNHIDLPTCTDDNREELIHYANVNILVEEFSINQKFNTASEEKETHQLFVVDAIGSTLYLKPHLFNNEEWLQLTIRQLWAKINIHLLNRNEELALHCLSQLLCKFKAMGKNHNKYYLELINFNSMSKIISEAEILGKIKVLERNKKLETVTDLYKRGKYKEVLSILVDSFEHFKTMDITVKNEMSSKFIVQLSLIVDTYWALGDVANCFKWSLIWLHEALRHYFRYTSGSAGNEKFTVTIVKLLGYMERILTTGGLMCLDSVSQKELGQGLENMIKIINHQVKTNASDMPFDTVVPWIIMYFILQIEEDQGTVRVDNDKNCNDVPNSLRVLFIAHEQLGNRGWCCKSEGKLLYFLLDTVVPRLRSPALSECFNQVCQNMEQCVYCLFDCCKKNDLIYLVDHNVTPHELNWERAQQVYEIFRPLDLPELTGDISGIPSGSEILFHRILGLLPAEHDPQKYVACVNNYIKGTEDKLPSVSSLLPVKMRDIYFFLGDFYYKNDNWKLSVEYNLLDVVVNNDRFESWAQIALSMSIDLLIKFYECENLKSDAEFFNSVKCITRCFKRTLQLDPKHSTMWIQYGMFAYTIHSFCSRHMKQTMESLSMADFKSLEEQKNDMLNKAKICFKTVFKLNHKDNDSDEFFDESWLVYYMLGKVAEKRNKPPTVYLDYYMKGVKCLHEAGLTYPVKINSEKSIEVLELHYRMHASILKYIEHHENKIIPNSVIEVFINCIEEWKNGPFMKKPKKGGAIQMKDEYAITTAEPLQPANTLKRLISDDKEKITKKPKRQAAVAKVRKSAKHGTEETFSKETAVLAAENNEPNKVVAISIEEKKLQLPVCKPDNIKIVPGNNQSKQNKSADSSHLNRQSEASTDSNYVKLLYEDKIMKIALACLDALEDCASRFPAHYKAIYRIAHYHYFYKKGKDLKRCRNLMLSKFTSRSGQKLNGLFNQRRHSNFFNNIWKIPHDEVDRAGSFAFHMNRAVLLLMDILKETSDYKTLLNLCFYLERTPEPNRKYLFDSDRQKLARQAFSLGKQAYEASAEYLHSLKKIKGKATLSSM